MRISGWSSGVCSSDLHIRPLVAGKVELGQQLTEGKPRNFLTYIDAHRSILIMGAERNDGLLELGIAYAGHGQQQVSGIKGGHIHSAKNIGVRGLGPTMLGGPPAIRTNRERDRTSVGEERGG